MPTRLKIEDEGSRSIDSQHFSHASPHGTLYSQWTSSGLYRLSWKSEAIGPDSYSPRSYCPAKLADRQHLAWALDHLLDRYFDGDLVHFDSIPVDGTGWTPLGAKIYQCCRQVESGRTCTYKDLAQQVGRPGASRAVGAAMARNRILLVIPCHRVIASSGRMQGFSGPGGIETKRALLELEQRCDRTI